MRFNLSHGRLGDVLLAMPAMRADDEVAAAPEHRVPGLAVTWLDPGAGGVTAEADHGRHVTDGWLRATDREPVRHVLMVPGERALTILAPHVADPRRQWPHWDVLARWLPEAVIIGPGIARLAWMRLLAHAAVVVCPNTGTAHMADALGARVVGLYADAHRDFLPYWDRAHCILRPTVARITVDEVLARVQSAR